MAASGLTEQTRLRLADGVGCQSLGKDQDSVVLSLASGYLYSCNKTTAAFIQSLDGLRTVGQVAELFAQRFEVTGEKALGDLLPLAGQMLDEGLIARAD